MTRSLNARGISTHYLTQRQTFFAIFSTFLSYYFNSLPHAEVDLRFAHCQNFVDHFNSLPHAEVDPHCHVIFILKIYFNSLPHAEVDITLQDIIIHQKIFQLTTSRRGRQQFVTKSMDINHRFHNKSHNKSLFFALIILCLSIFH